MTSAPDGGLPSWLYFLAPSMDRWPLPVVARGSCVDSQGNYRGHPRTPETNNRQEGGK